MKFRYVHCAYKNVVNRKKTKKICFFHTATSAFVYNLLCQYTHISPIICWWCENCLWFYSVCVCWWACERTFFRINRFRIKCMLRTPSHAMHTRCNSSEICIDITVNSTVNGLAQRCKMFIFCYFGCFSRRIIDNKLCEHNSFDGWVKKRTDVLCCETRDKPFSFSTW